MSECTCTKSWDGLNTQKCSLCKAAPQMLAACQAVIRDLDGPPEHKFRHNTVSLASQQLVREALTAAGTAEEAR